MIFHLPLDRLREATRWCRQSLSDFDFEGEAVTRIVTTTDGRQAVPFGCEEPAIRVEIQSEADAALFRLKWGEHLMHVAHRRERLITGPRVRRA